MPLCLRRRCGLPPPPPGEGHRHQTKARLWFMSQDMDNIPDARISGNRQGEAMVPGSPRSGRMVESCVGANQVDGLPACSRPGDATAVVDDSNAVRSVVDQYLGPRERSWLGTILATVRTICLSRPPPRKETGIERVYLIPIWRIFDLGSVKYCGRGL